MKVNAEFLSLPIYIEKMYYKDGWQKSVRTKSTIADIIEIWDIDNPLEQSEMVQVLRHLRDKCSNQ